MAEGHSFAILGGYGQLGRAVATRLLDRGAAGVTVAGRSRQKAEDAAKDLAGRNAAGQVAARGVDAGDRDGLAALLAGHDVVIHAAPLEGAASAALVAALTRSGGRLVLVSHDAEAIAALKAARAAFRKAGARVVVDAGADPGLPGLVGHLAAEAHGAADNIEIAARYRAATVGRAGLADLLDAAADAAWLYEDGWRRAGLFEIRRRTWPGGLGASLAMPVYLLELDALRDRHGLHRLALWHGGLNGVADMVVSARRLLGRAAPRRLGLVALQAAMRVANPPPYGLGISAVATGEGRRREVWLSHPDVYEATVQVAAGTAGILARDQHEEPSLRVAFEQLGTFGPQRFLEEHGFNLAFG